MRTTTIGLLTPLALLISMAITAAAAETATRPNILVLLTDDQRWDALGCMGNPIVQTPEMDRLAAEGTLFRNAFVTSSVCAASRASIFTGLYERSHQCNFNRGCLKRKFLEQSYPALLRRAGYYTGFIGKYGVGDGKREIEGRELFDRWFGFYGQGTYFPQDHPGQHLTEVTVEQVGQFLDGAPAERPFCLSVSFKAPHSGKGYLGYEPEPALGTLYENVTIPYPPTARQEFFDALPEFLRRSNARTSYWQQRYGTPQQYQTVMKDYFRLITGADRAIGRIRAELKRRGLDRRTVILFLSDNGDMTGDYLLGGKELLYDASLRVPIIVCDPRAEKSSRGQRRNELALNIDVAPTVVELAGLPVPPGMQGRSLVPLLRAGPAPWREDFYCENNFRQPDQDYPLIEGVRGTRWKYVRYPELTPVYEQLYDLSCDPLEVHDLARTARFAPELKQLRARCDELRAGASAQASVEPPPAMASDLPIKGLPTVNVKTFGAMGDCKHVMDGTMSKGSPVLISATAPFAPDDVGRPISVLEAGVQAIAGLGQVAGAPLGSRIVQVKNARTAVLADAAQQAVSGVSATWGSDDTQAIQRAIDSLNATGGTVFFPAGTYRVVYQGGPGLKVRGSNIRLQGTGPASAVFNSTVLFHAKVKDGVTCTEQMGVPVLYVGRHDRTIENVEVDHLRLGDNGQKYDFQVWGPEGPGVIGSAGKVDHWSFHDLTIETNHLCGLNTDSQTDGFSIYNVTVRSSANHGFYLAGAGSHGDVHDNRILGTTAPMRMGIAIKKKSHLRVWRNEVANVDFQGISVVGDAPEQVSRDVVIEDNWIHDLTAWHTSAITIFNAEDVTIRRNRIADTSFTAIFVYTARCTAARVVVQDNSIARVGKTAPTYFAISVDHIPPRNLPPGAPWPGSVRDVTIEGNDIRECPNGIAVAHVAGTNLIRANRVQNSSAAGKCQVGYSIQPLSSSTTAFSGNVGINCARYSVAPHVVQSGNQLE
jgi:arylsulfatase A-like enzyme